VYPKSTTLRLHVYPKSSTLRLHVYPKSSTLRLLVTPRVVLFAYTRVLERGGNPAAAPAMVVLDMTGLEGEFAGTDFDLGYSWLETAHNQIGGPPLTLGSVEEGDVLAMWDREQWSDAWPGREVFVYMTGHDHIVLFDANGCRLDEPSSGVPNGLQKVGGDMGFAQEWEGEAGYYTVPTLELGLQPLPPTPQTGNLLSPQIITYYSIHNFFYGPSIMCGNRLLRCP
jgi:hypothetical protein